jgi:putative tricarboxylic transport membrane protein
MDRRIDAAVAFAFVLFGLFMIFEAMTIKQGMMRDPIGPRAAFFVCGGIMAGGGLILIVRSVLAWREAAGNLMPSEGVADEEGYTASARQAFLLIAACFAYMLAFGPLGYILATPLFLVAAMAILGERHWGRAILIAVLFTAIFYFVFAQALGVRLPIGPLTGPFRALGWVNL